MGYLKLGVPLGVSIIRNIRFGVFIGGSVLIDMTKYHLKTGPHDSSIALNPKSEERKWQMGNGAAFNIQAQGMKMAHWD